MDWQAEIILYLKEGRTLEDLHQKRVLIRRSTGFTLGGDALYRRSFSIPLLKCLGSEKADYVMCEIHGGICGGKTKGRMLA